MAYLYPCYLGVVFVIARSISASPDRRSENIRVLTVVITELELGNIERHIFSAHFVECADYAALEYRPEAFNRLSVDCADDILTARMVNGGVRIFAVKLFVATPLICAKQADSRTNVPVLGQAADKSFINFDNAAWRLARCGCGSPPRCKRRRAAAPRR
jgi:hypothetical protein